MRENFLPFSPPSIGDAEIAEVVAVLRSGWLSTGPRARGLEDRVRDFVGGRAGALAVSSCTAAMHLGLKVFGVGEGDIVVTSPMTFASTVHVIEQVGAIPMLVDVERDTLNLDPHQVVRAVDQCGSGNVSALLPVHFAGHPCDLDPLLDLARREGLAVIEDAAHAFGASYRGSAIGRVEDDLRHAVCFSFYATKNLTTAEGGMLLAGERAIEEARVWSLHGMTSDAAARYEAGGSWHYEVVAPGYKYNLSDLHAAIGVAQMGRFAEMQERRQAIAKRYCEALEVFEEVQVPSVRPDVAHAWHLFPLRLNLDRLSIHRGQFIKELSGRNIGSSVHFIPVHMHPYYREKYGYDPEDFPVALREFQRVVSLPLHAGLTDEDVEDVIGAISDICARFRLTQ